MFSVFFLRTFKLKKKNRKGKEGIRWSGGLVTESEDQGASVILPFHETSRKLFLSLDPLRVYLIVASYKARMIA